jgi:hypothetical protein
MTYTTAGARAIRATVQAALERQGFNVDRYPSVSCDACAALVINGVPCHETGCPNAMHECNGCNALIPIRRRYCDDCS